MMRHLAIFFVLLFDLRYVGILAQSVIWKFPTQGQGLQANTKDTVLLDWTSTLPSTILRMWCENGTDGGNFALASSFFVDSTGPFEYILETYDPNETAFPFSCHAEIAADPTGSGFDSPAGIVWSSNSAQAAKTISQTQAAPPVTVTVVSSPTSVSASPISTATATPSTAFSTTNSVTKSTTPTPSTKRPTTIPTTSLESPSGATPASQSASASASSASSSPSNTGAIVGGAIGGVALLSFIVLALLFLRRYQRDHASSSPLATESSKRSFYLFNAYKKRSPNARTTGVFEIEGENGTYEKEGASSSQGRQVQEKGLDSSDASRWVGAHEVQGSAAWKKTASSGEGRVGGSENHVISYGPVELPGDAR